jgi:hypothetical protein
MNLKRTREKIIEAMKMRTVAHHGESVEVAKKYAKRRIPKPYTARNAE